MSPQAAIQPAETAPESAVPVLRLEAIHKVFGGVVALQSVSLDVYAGEVVALVGDNGAGKSTLVKIVCGVQPATSGRILIDGEEAHLANPSEAQRRGIQVVFQDLAMAE